ncbi:MAG TPA: hypothetical protein PLC79_12845 [Phycisphaerae bacterium]|nr:hypothetical protein [Phycisphaerae bacterium]
MANESQTPSQPVIIASKVTSIACLGCVITGVAGIVLALVRSDSSGLIGSGLAFGLLANAILRR